MIIRVSFSLRASCLAALLSVGILALTSIDSRADPACDAYARNVVHSYGPSGGAIGGAIGGALGGGILGGIFGGKKGFGVGALFGGGIGLISGGVKQSEKRQQLYYQAYEACMSGRR